MGLLNDLVKAEKEGSYLFTTKRQHSILVNNGLAIINESITDDTGRVATRPTSKGIEYINSKGEDKKMSGVSMATSFEIETVELPATKRGSGKTRNSKYPFDALEVGQSFFVPNSEECPDPAKTITSTVNSANQRYATPELDVNGNQVMRTNRKGNLVPKMILTRKFVIRKDEKNGVKGVRIGRIS